MSHGGDLGSAEKLSAADPFADDSFRHVYHYHYEGLLGLAAPQHLTDLSER